MPIDSPPEGHEVLHPPLVKPFPESTGKNDADTQSARTPDGEKVRDVDSEDSGQGLPHGSLSEASLVKPPLGN